MWDRTLRETRCWNQGMETARQGKNPSEAKPHVKKAKRNGRERSDESTTTYSTASWIRSKPRQWLLVYGEQAQCSAGGQGDGKSIVHSCTPQA